MPIHRIYTICQRFGLVISCTADYDNYPEQYIDFDMVRSNKTDQLKPKHRIRLGSDIIKVKFHSESENCSAITSFGTVPPAFDHQTPEHMLNDDSLRQIFIASDLLDLCSLAQVSQRFRHIAIQIAAAKRTIKITVNDVQPLWKWEKYFRIFGSSIRRIELTTDYDTTNILLYMISKYCANVDELYLERYDGQITRILTGLFKRVKILNLYHAGTMNGILYAHAPLESLDIFSWRSTLPSIQLPKLVNLRLREIDWRDQMATERFFAINRQLVKLAVYRTMPEYDFGYILKYLTQLQELDMELTSHPNFAALVCDNFAVFGHLKRLHTLKMCKVDGGYIAKILSAMIDSKVQLRRLTLLKRKGIYPVDVICHMKSIESLKIDDIDDADLIRLGKKLANLREIYVESIHITPQSIRTMVKKASYLDRAKFVIEMDRWCCNGKLIEFNVFDAVAELRKRCDVTIELIAYDPIDIPVSSIYTEYC